MELVAFFMIAFDRCWAQVFMPFCSRHSNYDIIQHFVLVHLSELLLLYTLPREISVPPQIHAFSKSFVLVPKTFGQRSFLHVGLSTWNDLPYSLRHSDSQASFRQALKTHLFQ